MVKIIGLPRTAKELRARTDRGDRAEYHLIHAVASLLEIYRAVGDSRDQPIDHSHSVECALEIVQEYSDRYSNRFKHVLVDEFQDISGTDIEFIEALLGSDTHLFAVGDDWQSILGFRGSRPELFRQFESRFNQTVKTTLETNYRCPPGVVEASTSLMAASDEATQKAVSASVESGSAPIVHTLEGAYNDRQAAYISKLVQNAISDGIPYDDIKILAHNSKLELARSFDSDSLRQFQLDLLNHFYNHTDEIAPQCKPTYSSIDQMHYRL